MQSKKQASLPKNRPKLFSYKSYKTYTSYCTDSIESDKPIKYYKTVKRGGTSIILRNSRNEVLLFLRDDKPEIPYPNMWDVPGGHVEAGETPEATIVREMLEEIETDVSACQRSSVYDFPDRIEYIFLMDFEAAAETIPLHEGQRLRWFSEQDIPWDNLAYGFDIVLADYFAGRERWDNEK